VHGFDLRICSSHANRSDPEMLGVPIADQRKFHRWSASITSADPSGWRMLADIPHVIQFLRYIRALIKTKRDFPKDDLISALVQAEEAGDKLNEDELVAMIFLLLVAGHETTVNLIGNSILSLLENPCSWNFSETNGH
jgi:cytochrome P450